MGILKKIVISLASLFLIAITALALTIGYTKSCDTTSPIAVDQSDTSMKSVVYHCYGGPEVLRYQNIEKPQPTDTELLIKVEAAGVNPLDWHYMRGSPYLMRLVAGIGAPDDPTMGVDFAGTVEATGSAVTRFKVGDRVYGGVSGAFSEYAIIDESRSIAQIPDSVSFEQAAAMPIAAVSALQALRDSGQLQNGQSVLINGASGGVGTFAVQIAKSMGARVAGVCSTRNVEMVSSLGADRIFDYKKEDFVESGEQYDLIIDNVGNRSISELLRVLKPEGTLVMVGGPSGDWVGPFKNTFPALVNSMFVSQNLNSFLATMNQEDLAILANLMDDGKIRSVIDKRYPLEQTTDAIRYSESGRARGKIVILM